jgi:hypothetical protein
MYMLQKVLSSDLNSCPERAASKYQLSKHLEIKEI